MKDTTATSSEREALHAQVEKLSRSAILHGSESLCKLLRYLTEHSLDSRGTPLKEYQIATEVFGRPADFDPRLDSTVRVQTGRLRSKLAEYYGNEGANDRVIVEIPKGAYSLTYHVRPSAEEPPPPAPVIPVQPKMETAPESRSVVFPRSWIALAILIAAILVAVSVAITKFTMPVRSNASPIDGPAASVRIFWGTFAGGPDEPLIVYSNAEFVGRPETGLRYADPIRDIGKKIQDHYTGVGEVMSVHELDRLFSSLQQEIRVKRGRLMSWDDAKTSDLVFIGSPSENLSLRELSGTRDFMFTRKPDDPRKGDLMISNLHPNPGEQAEFLATEEPITEDYALVVLTTGLNPNRHVLILAGITTFGTQAAVEYVCRAARLEELLARLGVSGHTRVPPFEALLRIKVSGGVPVQSDLIALHSHARDAQSSPSRN